MIQKALRIAALLILCALLVYAPELLASVSAPYGVRVGERTLLRVALCTQDQDAASAFYRAVSSYQKENGSLHLRVTRASADRIADLPEPLPDLYVFSPGAVDAPEALFIPLRSEEGEHRPEQGVWNGMRYAAVFPAGEGHTLLCAACTGAREHDAAQALLIHLLSAADTPAADP